MPHPSPAAIEVVAPNFKRRMSGVTATVIRLVPRQAETGLAIAATGGGLEPGVRRLPIRRLLALRWPPAGRPVRIWHARRNVEMAAGIVLRDVLRFPLALVFTSAAQRRHKRPTRWMIRRMDAVIAASEGAAAYLERPATIIPHGVDTDHFRPAGSAERLIGCFGRIRPQKGTDLFVEAMLALLPSRPGWRAVILGRAVGRHRRFLAALEARIAAAGLADRIRFLGEVSDADVASWYRRLDLYVAPSRREGFGLTPLEAMASGAAVVATGAGAASQLVVDGITGRLVPPDDGSALTAAIAELIDDPERLAGMRRAARAHVIANHAIAREVDAIGAVYDALWAKAPPRTKSRSRATAPLSRSGSARDA